MHATKVLGLDFELGNAIIGRLPDSARRTRPLPDRRRNPAGFGQPGRRIRGHGGG